MAERRSLEPLGVGSTPTSAAPGQDRCFGPPNPDQNITAHRFLYTCGFCAVRWNDWKRISACWVCGTVKKTAPPPKLAREKLKGA